MSKAFLIYVISVVTISLAANSFDAREVKRNIKDGKPHKETVIGVNWQVPLNLNFDYSDDFADDLRQE